MIGQLLLRGNRVVSVLDKPNAALATVPEGELPVLGSDMLVERTGTRLLIDALRAKLGFPAEMFSETVWPVIAAFAEFVQLLPASESHHHAEPGGLFTHTVEVVNLALDYRRGQVLPKGAPPEAIGEQAHRWTYAVFIAALLHDVGKPIADLRVLMRKGAAQSEPWSPLAGSMFACDATSYRVEFAERALRHYELHGKLPVLLLNRFVPASILGWLSADSGLIRELLPYLAGDKAAEQGVLHQLVSRADAESVRRNLMSGSRVRFATARRVPLIEQLMHALRAMLQEGGRLPLNRSGAAGWVYGGDVWFVSKRLADEVRAYLLAREPTEDGIPRDNQRLFDTWQEYGAAIPNPKTGGAVWDVLVVGPGYRHPLTVLRFPLSILFEHADAYPVAMQGRIEITERSKEETVIERAKTASDKPDRPDPKAGPDSRPSPGESGRRPRVDCELRRDGTQENALGLHAAGATTGGRIETTGEVPAEAEEYLEAVEERARAGAEAPSPGTRRPAPMPRPAVEPAWLGGAGSTSRSGDAAPEAALRFMGWVQEGLASGRLHFNESGALVHFVPEGMLLVSPRIFREFAKLHGEDGRGGAQVEDESQAGKGIQRQLLRAAWHVRADKGVNILTYQVVRGGRTISQLSGVVIGEPARFVSPVPPANPVLVRAAPGPGDSSP